MPVSTPASSPAAIGLALHSRPHALVRSPDTSIVYSNHSPPCTAFS